MLRFYSNSPGRLPLACLLRIMPLVVQELPLTQLGQATPTDEEELLSVSLELAAVAEQLEAHDSGETVLNAGTEKGLRAYRDALRARQLNVLARKGGQRHV